MSLNTNTVDATQSCEALLQNLNEDYQIIPMLKTALQRGWSDSFMKSLNSYVDEKQHAVQDICNKNYMTFCDSMDKVIKMKRDVDELSETVTTFHDDIQFSGIRTLKEANNYIKLQDTYAHVNKAYDDILVFDNLASLVERVENLIADEKYYLALKTLDTLKANLKEVPACRLSRNIEAFIKPKTDEILDRCRQSFFKWCRDIRPISQMIGEASMIRAFNRKQENSASKKAKEGVEDILEKVDLSIVFEYQHVFEHVGRLHEFKDLYVERREKQCDFEELASRNLKALSTDQFCSLLNGLLYSSIGYFFVEDSLQRGSLLYSDSTHMQSLFAGQLQVLTEALEFHLRSVGSVEELLKIETSVWTYAEVMSGQPLLFNVEPIYDMRPQLVEQSVAIIQSSVVTGISDAFENDRHVPFQIYSLEDYFGVVARFQLLDETPSSFPFICPFSSTVPSVLQLIAGAVSKLDKVCSSLGVGENFAPLQGMVAAVLDSLAVSLESQLEEGEEDVKKLGMMSLNWSAFARSVGSLQRVLLADDERQGGGALLLDKKKRVFESQQSKLQDLIVELILGRCDGILESLKDAEVLAPSSPAQQAHGCVEELKQYLGDVFGGLEFLSRSFIEVCQFTTCRHIAQYFQQVLIESEEPVNVVGVFDLNLDLLSLESFIEELDVPDLVQCFTDVHQLYSLLLSGRITDILDDEIRNSLYPLVAMPILISVLQNIKEVKKLPLMGKKMMIPALKKKDVDAVLQHLQEMYE